MLHTQKETGDGLVPADDSWLPVVRHRILRGPTALALQTARGWAMVGILVSLIPIMVVAFVSSHGTNLRAWVGFAVGPYFFLAMATGVLSIASMIAARREYRHGYTTLQDFGRPGLYYRVMAQVDPHTGVEVRAPNQAKLDWATLKNRNAAARASQPRAERMTRAEAAQAVIQALPVDAVNREITRINSARGQFVIQFGPVAGNMRADARNIIIAVTISGFASVPLLVFSALGAYEVRNPALLLPYAVLAICLTLLAAVGRRKSGQSTKLAAEYLSVPPSKIPRLTLAGPLAGKTYKTNAGSQG
ncbi:hypothetical protein AL755_21700 [Arthrobacter sp. ERGS1:01]|uniref:hypothetical protein n=1 Tax=Arthrobacter sp. ERGS1:01 TaxID=1704044 RepID=UPI0006B5E33D|nr:hypothetical protein [Arthrobacter sp. ERGS1:01]ALE07487.1 hypothetical protein AL755_21700 [Arthrobacter sp. ERGS1:01]